MVTIWNGVTELKWHSDFALPLKDPIPTGKRSAAFSVQACAPKACFLSVQSKSKPVLRHFDTTIGKSLKLVSLQNALKPRSPNVKLMTRSWKVRHLDTVQGIAIFLYIFCVWRSQELQFIELKSVSVWHSVYGAAFPFLLTGAKLQIMT